MTPPPDSSTRITNTPQAARKQVTVLFCDIADYSERTSAMDPEDLADEIREFQTICSQIAESFQGHISNFLGDGILILFGHPHASEFSPEHAVRAGLAMVEAIKQNNLKPTWHDREPLSIRIGIATGLVVVGEKAGRQRDQDEQIIGVATNLAARLQGLARPNTAVTSLRTRRLVGLAFKFKDLGNFSIKGFNQPVNAWQVLSERKMQQRPGNTLKRNATTFISRKKQLAMLRLGFDKARLGSSCFIHIRGDPGIGKTRLVRTFERQLIDPEIRRMRINCSPYYQNSFLKPVRDECFRWLSVSENDSLETRQDGVKWATSAITLGEREQHILFTEFLDIPLTSPARYLDLSPEEKRQCTISVLVQVIVEISKLGPILLVVEDLHWADSSTLELLTVLMQKAPRERVMGVFTSRSDFSPFWAADDSPSLMALEGLTRVESKQLVESLFKNHHLPENLKQNLIRKSDGVPLFLEESCHSAINYVPQDSGNGPLYHGYSVPESLQDLLNERLDQLASAKPMAQLASTFGDSFTYQLISELARLNGIDADHGMDTLIEENILVLENCDVDDHFKFRHAMFQEASYQSLLIKTRQNYHNQIASLLLTRDPNFADKHAELIAYHFSRTEQIARAISLWIKAGRTAMENSAIVDSIDHLQQGLALIPSLAPGAEKQKLELRLLLALGVSLTARAGYYGFEVSQTYERAAVPARKIGDDRQQWTAIYGLWRCKICQAEFARATRLSAILTSLCRKNDDPVLKLAACGIKAMTRMVDGKLSKADKLNDQAVLLYDQIQDKQIGLQLGQNPFVTIQGLGAVTKLLTGDIEGSVVGIKRSVSVARRIGHPYTIAETLKVASMYEQISDNMERLRNYCVEAIRLSEQYGFEGVHATHCLFLAFADLVQDKDPNQLGIIENNLILYEQKYGLLFLPYFQGLLAEAYLILERFEEAFDTAKKVLYDIEQNGEKWVQPQILRLMSEAACRGKLAPREKVGRWYRSAVETALTQHSTLFLGRILHNRSSFTLDPETARRYDVLADPIPQ